jgi:hypothetical protein
VDQVQAARKIQRSKKAVEFIQDIMHRFEIPNRVITDLGSPFTAIEYKNWA